MNSDVAESILDAERRLNSSRQVLSINIQEDNIEAANELLLQQRVTRASKRASSQQESQFSKKNKIFPDTITIAGLRGTLGENLARLGDDTPLNCAENRYIKNISKNGIVDLTLSTSNSQVAQLGGPHTMNFLKRKFSYASADLDNSEGMFDALNKKSKELRGSNVVDAYNFVDLYKTTSSKERALKDIYKHIIYQHAYKGHMLTDQYFLKCSEQSTINKYWNHIFESYFGENNNIFIQWGDTLSVDCKNVDLNCKLDLRMITDTEKGLIEATTGEFASTKTTTEGKLYNGKLKSVLASKCHLNSLLKKLVYLPQSQVTKVNMPILQIMGQNISLYSLSLIDKQVYSVQNIMDAEYPRTYIAVRSGGIKKIIDLLGQLEYMMDEIEESMKSYSRDTTNKMKVITGKGKQVREFKTEAWISSVEWDTCVLDD